MPDARVRVAWSLFLATFLLAIVEVVFVAASGEPPISAENMDEGFPLVTIAAVASSAVGALIVTRYPTHRIGWLFLIGQLGTMVGLATQAYGHNAMTGGWGSYVSGQVALWISIQTGGAFSLALVGLLLLLAPDGRLLSPRWILAMGVTVLGLVLHMVDVAMVSPRDLDADGQLAEPPRLLVVVELIAVAAIGVGLIAGAVSLFIRLRRATGDEKAQLRWISAAAAALAFSVPLHVTLEAAFGVDPWLGILPVMVAYLLLPLCTGIAILRFHLYNIDVILNRSIVLTVLTGFVASVYIVLVVVFSELNVADDETSSWTALLATALAALAFQPMRRRVNRLADRLVYGAQAAPYETLAQFSDELRSSTHLAEMLPRLAEAAGRAVGARRAEIGVDTPGQGDLYACWPPDADPDVCQPVDLSAAATLVVPVTDEDDRLGELRITMPPARGLRPSEHRLLDDLAAQLAEAFRGYRLESELAVQVDLLARQSDALEKSSRRLISAASAERGRFESAIARDVLPHLAPMPRELADLTATSARSGLWPDQVVDHLVERTNTALESLRTLTRGVFPAQLSHKGLLVALLTHLRLAGLEEALSADESLMSRRFDPRIESIAYFCAVEALRSLAAPVYLAVSVDESVLTLDARGCVDDGLRELDTEHLVDRAESVGGRLTVDGLDHPDRGGTRVRIVIQLPVDLSPDFLPGLAENARLKG
jgi:hypothetical protein